MLNRSGNCEVPGILILITGDDQAVVSPATMPTKGDPQSNKKTLRTPARLVPSMTRKHSCDVHKGEHNCKVLLVAQLQTLRKINKCSNVAIRTNCIKNLNP